ncbi:hypothetical protein [Micromonospora sp. NPDC005171]|uniref:hypothetical protein n=1 Tax=Micromonospora sp. NPDC005171 TaxID=3156866 RepID=UPI0033B30C33
MSATNAGALGGKSPVDDVRRAAWDDQLRPENSPDDQQDLVHVLAHQLRHERRHPRLDQADYPLQPPLPHPAVVVSGVQAIQHRTLGGRQRHLCGNGRLVGVDPVWNHDRLAVDQHTERRRRRVRRRR